MKSGSKPWPRGDGPAEPLGGNAVSVLVLASRGIALSMIQARSGRTKLLQSEVAPPVAIPRGGRIPLRVLGAPASGQQVRFSRSVYVIDRTSVVRRFSADFSALWAPGRSRARSPRPAKPAPR